MAFFIIFVAFMPALSGDSGPLLDIPVNKDNLREHITTLTGMQPPRNHLNTESLHRSAGYIKDRFAEYGGRVSKQEFTAGGGVYENVLASFGPEGGERVVVGAHYDVFNNQPGADDNASGVAGLLELARLLGERSPAHRVDLVAYCLEEPPYFGTSDMGSAVHARSLAEGGVRVRAMLSLEMIGYFSEEEGSQRFPFWLMKLFYPDRADFIAVVGNRKSKDLIRKTAALMSDASNIGVETLSAPFFITEAGFSDHRNYWEHGYKAAMVTDTSFFRSPHYHRETDTIETLDFVKMAEVVKGVYWAVLNL